MFSKGYPDDSEALDTWVKTQVEKLRRHIVFHRIPNYILLVLLIDIIRILEIVWRQKINSSYFIFQILTFLVYVPAYFIFRYESVRVTRIAQINHHHGRSRHASTLVITDIGQDIWRWHYAVLFWPFVKQIMLNFCKSYPEYCIHRWMVRLGEPVSEWHEVLMIFTPLMVMIQDHSLRSGLTGVAINLSYNIIHASLKPDAVKVSPAHQFIFTFLFFSYIVFIFAENDRIQGEFILSQLRQEEELKSSSAFQRYVFHELRLPINSLFLAIDLLQQSYKRGRGLLLQPRPSRCAAEKDDHNGDSRDKREGEAFQDLMDMVYLHCKTIQNLMEDSRRIMKLRDGEARLNLGVFDLRDVISDLCTNKKDLFFAKELKILVHIESIIPDGLLGDGARLSKALDSCLTYATRRACMDPVASTITVDIQVLSVRKLPDHDYLHNLASGEGDDAANGGREQKVRSRGKSFDNEVSKVKVKPANVAYLYGNKAQGLYKSSGETYDIKVSVTVNNCVTSDEDLKRVFEPFTTYDNLTDNDRGFQSGYTLGEGADGGKSEDSERDPLHRNNGMGMSIAQQLVELHGGTMGIESNVYQGTTVFFDLSLQRVEKVEMPPDDAAGDFVIRNSNRDSMRRFVQGRHPSENTNTHRRHTTGMHGPPHTGSHRGRHMGGQDAFDAYPDRNTVDRTAAVFSDRAFPGAQAHHHLHHRHTQPNHDYRNLQHPDHLHSDAVSLRTFSRFTSIDRFLEHEYHNKIQEGGMGNNNRPMIAGHGADGKTSGLAVALAPALPSALPPALPPGVQASVEPRFLSVSTGNDGRGGSEGKAPSQSCSVMEEGGVLDNAISAAEPEEEQCCVSVGDIKPEECASKSVELAVHMDDEKAENA